MRVLLFTATLVSAETLQTVVRANGAVQTAVTDDAEPLAGASLAEEHVRSAQSADLQGFVCHTEACCHAIEWAGSCKAVKNCGVNARHWTLGSVVGLAKFSKGDADRGPGCVWSGAGLTTGWLSDTEQPTTTCVTYDKGVPVHDKDPACCTKLSGDWYAKASCQSVPGCAWGEDRKCFSQNQNLPELPAELRDEEPPVPKPVKDEEPPVPKPVKDEDLPTPPLPNLGDPYALGRAQPNDPWMRDMLATQQRRQAEAEAGPEPPQKCRLAACGCPAEGYKQDWCTASTSRIVAGPERAAWCNAAPDHCEECGGAWCGVEAAGDSGDATLPVLDLSKLAGDLTPWAQRPQDGLLLAPPDWYAEGDCLEDGWYVWDKEEGSDKHPLGGVCRRYTDAKLRRTSLAGLACCPVATCEGAARNPAFAGFEYDEPAGACHALLDAPSGREAHPVHAACCRCTPNEEYQWDTGDRSRCRTDINDNGTGDRFRADECCAPKGRELPAPAVEAAPERCESIEFDSNGEKTVEGVCLTSAECMALSAELPQVEEACEGDKVCCVEKEWYTKTPEKVRTYSTADGVLYKSDALEDNMADWFPNWNQ